MQSASLFSRHSFFHKFIEQIQEAKGSLSEASSFVRGDHYIANNLAPE